jgi:hypothetical protein
MPPYLFADEKTLQHATTRSTRRRQFHTPLHRPFISYLLPAVHAEQALQRDKILQSSAALLSQNYISQIPVVYWVNYKQAYLEIFF